MCFCLQTNTFQAVLATDGQHSFVIFNYLDDGMNWSKGDDSSVPAQVGYNFGGAELNSLTLPGSRMENITDIDIVTNLNIPGHFIFRIDDLVPQTGCSNTIGMQVMYTHSFLDSLSKSLDKLCKCPIKIIIVFVWTISLRIFY